MGRSIERDFKLTHADRRLSHRERVATSGAQRRSRIREQEMARSASDDLVETLSPTPGLEMPFIQTVPAEPVSLGNVTMADMLDMGEPVPPIVTAINPGEVYTLFDVREAFPEQGFHTIRSK